MAPTFRCVYRTVGNCEIHTDVYIPPPPAPSSSTTRPKCPVVIGIHGGAFMLGASSMVNSDQIDDCLSRGWIAVIPDHRLCPQVDILGGPIADMGSLLTWIQNGGLEAELERREAAWAVDVERIVAFGTSSGGTLALALGCFHPAPPLAILDLYGATHFAHPFWRQPLSHMTPPNVPASFINRVYSSDPVPTQGGVSLEGQSRAPGSGPPPPDPSDPRPAFAFTHIANGTLLDVCLRADTPTWAIDAVPNVTAKFPPTCIVHGTDDVMVPMHLSQELFKKLQGAGVRSEMVEVEGEGHTFAGKMVRGGKTWDRQRLGFDFLEREIGLSR